MSDLIDRQDAIYALRTHERKASNKWFDNQLDIEWNNAIDICCYDIEDLPSAQPEQRWIPWDSGKFPEESGTYTVTAYDGATMRVTYAKYQKRLKRWELTGARAYWRVLAWMPLPEPYKEG